jgi:hypothetical protein
MKLSNYRTLISHLPVKEQSFTTKKSTWLKAENDYSWLKELNKTLFDKYGQLTLNRQDVFNSKTIEEIIIKTIYWGYPRGKRGNHFRNILNSFDVLVLHCSQLKDSETITSAEYFKLMNDFKKIEGLGLSTYTKILYFMDIKIDYNPCLILDQRIINVIQTNHYPCFKYLSINNYNKEKKYPEYLALMNHLSQELQTKPENLEQFLFLFNNLKSLKSPSIFS